MIQNLHPNYKIELLQHFNQSLHTGCYPSEWKKGHVIPIPKPDKPKELCKSYRPITLLSCLGKLMERIIKNRIEFHLETNKLLSNTQFGFRPNKGTDDVLVAVTEEIKFALSSSQYCAVLYFDIEGAFDAVWRNGLLFKASQLGIKGNILKWLRSYLAERSNVVAVQGHESTEFISRSGVPQGGVLSPIIFNIMMYDLPTRGWSKCLHICGRHHSGLFL